MPYVRPKTPRTRDQLVSYESHTDEGKERLLSETTRVVADIGTRIGTVEASLDKLTAAPAVTGSRASGAALVSLLEVLAGLGLITDKTTP